MISLRAAILAAAVGPLSAAVASCAGARRDGAGPSLPILASPVGPGLEALWRGHGGIDRWRRIGRVRFRCETEVGPDAFPARGPGFEESAPREPISHREEFSIRGSLILEGLGPPGPSLEDYAARSARALFAFPFLLSDPMWEFSLDLIPGLSADPREGFWASPRAPGWPHRQYQVEIDPATGLVRELHYQIDHPCFRGQIFRAIFEDYREVAGLRLPMRITHLAPRPSRASRRAGGDAREGYPWEGGEGASAKLAPSSAAEERFILRDRILDLELLERGAAGEAPPAAAGETLRR